MAAIQSDDGSFDDVLKRISVDEKRFTFLAIRLLEREQQDTKVYLSRCLDERSNASKRRSEEAQEPSATHTSEQARDLVKGFTANLDRFASAVEFISDFSVSQQARLALGVLRKKQKHFTLLLARLALSGGGPASKRANSATRSREQAHIEHTHNITESLRECKAVLQQQIDQVDAAATTLSQDSQVLGSTRSTYREQKEKMEQASRLLHTIKQKERTDNMIFYGGLCFFFLVVTFIVTKRTGILWLVTSFLRSFVQLIFGGEPNPEEACEVDQDAIPAE